MESALSGKAAGLRWSQCWPMRTRSPLLVLALGAVACTSSHGPIAAPRPTPSLFKGQAYAYTASDLWIVRGGIATRVRSNLGSAGSVATSPDGKWIAMSVRGGIDIVSSADPSRVRTRIKVPANRDLANASYRASLVWSDDSRSIAYETSREPKPLPKRCIYGCPIAEFHFVNRDGSTDRLFASIPGDLVLERYTHGF